MDSSTIRIPLDIVLQLPPYCADSQYGKGGADASNYTPAQRHWASLMGPTFHHIHHYCLALDSMRKARSAPTPQFRRGLYGAAINDLNYVVERAPADFILLPELYLRLGQSTFGRADVAGALEYFDKARRAKPDYWPAYIEIAKTNLSFGRRKEAEEALREGLAAAPEEPNLKQALAQLSAAGSAKSGKSATN